MKKLLQKRKFKALACAGCDGGAGVGYELIQCLKAEVAIALVLDAARKVCGENDPAHFHISTPRLA